MNTPMIWHLRAQQRAKVRQDASHDHLSRFITTELTIPYTPYHFAELPQDPYGRVVDYDYYSESPWRAAPWAAQRVA